MLQPTIGEFTPVQMFGIFLTLTITFYMLFLHCFHGFDIFGHSYEANCQNLYSMVAKVAQHHILFVVV